MRIHYLWQSQTLYLSFNPLYTQPQFHEGVKNLIIPTDFWSIKSTVTYGTKHSTNWMNTLENYVKNSNTFAVLYLHFTLMAKHFPSFHTAVQNFLQQLKLTKISYNSGIF